MNWYAAHARPLPWREGADPYAIWISEVMLQQTRVAAVLAYYTRWMTALPTVKDLAAVDDARLHKLWEGLGYYSRAKNLKRAAGIVMAEYGGKLPENFDELCALPGIGAYTAGAIASIAFNRAVPAMDGNVLRVWARLTDDNADVLDPKVKKRMTADVAALVPIKEPGRFNAALMELGETVCLPNAAPLCQSCPLTAICRARAAGTAVSLPRRSKKKPRRMEYKTVFVLMCAGAPAVFRRPDTGLLAGLWQLPEQAGLLDTESAARALDIWGARPTGAFSVYERKHLFTHVEWHMRVYAVKCDLTLPEGWSWLDESMALPAAYRICLSPERRD